MADVNTIFFVESEAYHEGEVVSYDDFESFEGITLFIDETSMDSFLESDFVKAKGFEDVFVEPYIDELLYKRPEQLEHNYYVTNNINTFVYSILDPEIVGSGITLIHPGSNGLQTMPTRVILVSHETLVSYITAEEVPEDDIIKELYTVIEDNEKTGEPFIVTSQQIIGLPVIAHVIENALKGNPFNIYNSIDFARNFTSEGNMVEVTPSLVEIYLNISHRVDLSEISDTIFSIIDIPITDTTHTMPLNYIYSNLYTAVLDVLDQAKPITVIAEGELLEFFLDNLKTLVPSTDPEFILEFFKLYNFDTLFGHSREYYEEKLRNDELLEKSDFKKLILKDNAYKPRDSRVALLLIPGGDITVEDLANRDLPNGEEVLENLINSEYEVSIHNGDSKEFTTEIGYFMDSISKDLGANLMNKMSLKDNIKIVTFKSNKDLNSFISQEIGNLEEVELTEEEMIEEIKSKLSEVLDDISLDNDDFFQNLKEGGVEPYYPERKLVHDLLNLLAGKQPVEGATYGDVVNIIDEILESDFIEYIENIVDGELDLDIDEGLNYIKDELIEAWNSVVDSDSALDLIDLSGYGFIYQEDKTPDSLTLYRCLSVAINIYKNS